MAHEHHLVSSLPTFVGQRLSLLPALQQRILEFREEEKTVTSKARATSPSLASAPRRGHGPEQEEGAQANLADGWGVSSVALAAQLLKGLVR